MTLDLILITANPDEALEADSAGVQRVMVDLESIGKAERQRTIDAHLGAHPIDAIDALSRCLQGREAELVVRVNPLGSHSRWEITEALRRGAERLMLPMFKETSEVVDFLELVDGRVPVILLVETAQALTRLPLIADLTGPGDEIYFGLNDLSLSLGLDFLFEPLAGGVLEFPAQLLKERGIPFGFGGVARVGEGLVPAELVLSEHVRLGSTSVILSRAFREPSRRGSSDFVGDVQRLRETEAHLRSLPLDTLLENRLRLGAVVFGLANQDPAQGD